MKKLFLSALLASVLSGGLFAQMSEMDSSVFKDGLGIQGTVFAMVVQPDGRIVIGGDFSNVNGLQRQNIARLNPDGTVDKTFAARAQDGPNGPVLALALHPSGGIIVGGDFSMAGETVRNNIALYRADGSVDRSFAAYEGGVGANGAVSALAVQADGKIVAGGSFTTFYGKIHNALVRLNPDGTMAADIAAPQALNGTVKSLLVLPGGGVVAAGNFSMPKMVPRGIFRSSN